MEDGIKGRGIMGHSPPPHMTNEGEWTHQWRGVSTMEGVALGGPWLVWLLTTIVELNIYHKHKGFILEWIFMCFIKIHKVNSSKYEWSLDLLTVVFDRWIFITNTKGTQRFPSWINMNLTWTAVTCFLKVATFIYKLHTDMTLFKHELMLHTFLRCR